MKRFWCIAGAFLLVVLFLTGCGKKEEKGIVGRWVYESNAGYFYTFNEDKTCSYTFGESVSKCTYEDDGTRVTIMYEGMTEANVFEYTIEENELHIEDSYGSKLTYIKK